MESAQPTQSADGRSVERVVTFAGLIYAAGLVLFFMVQFAVSFGSIPEFLLILLPFVAVFIGAAVGVWRGSRAAYVAGVASSVVLLGFQGPEIVGGLAETTNTGFFVASVTITPVLAMTIVYGVLGLRQLRPKTGAVPVRMIPRSTLLALFVIGFVVGGLLVGLIAGGVQARLIANIGATGDIQIVQGAGTPNSVDNFVNKTFEARVGQTVTWVNRDSTTHTVTSDTGAFNSGSIPLGDKWSHTFTQAGTYTYHCDPHPWMTGTVVVTSN